MAGIETAVEAARRYIIKRPRLTRLLDKANARVLMLIAPAGFGKTTLAREWAGDRTHVWYQGTSATADVAALAAGLSEVVSELIPDAGSRMIHRMRATGTPEEDVDVLAELFAEDLTEWPEDAWLVFDDYQFAMEAKAPERFIEVLLRDAPVRLLLTSRKRPSWASARRLLYGEVYELGRTELAMDHDEAASVLAHRKDAPAAGLVALAEGWPAVIGLAALTDDFELPEGSLPDTLYDYFAEELYQAASSEVQRGLCLLALAPSLGRDVAELLLGKETKAVVAEAIRLGFLTSPRQDILELHPLLRAFLDARLRVAEDETEQLAAELALHFAAHYRWDDAFALSDRFFSEEVFVQLFEAALPAVLRDARLPTLSHLLKRAQREDVDAAIVDLAEAELAFRLGQRRKAEALALQAARRFGPEHGLASHCFYLAGTSAHVDLRHQDALRHHQRARDAADSPAAARDATWGQLLAVSDMGGGDSSVLLEALVSANDGTPESEVRLAGARHMAQIAVGDVSSAIADLEPASHLLPRVQDPLVRSSFKHTYAQALVWAARYAEARSVAEDCLRDASASRLAFVVARAERLKAMAEIGLRRFARASSLLDRIEGRVAAAPDPFLAAEVRILRLRMLIALALPEKAMEVSFNDAGSASTAEYAEYLASMSLALACAGRQKRAPELAREAEDLMPSIEVRVLRACSAAVSSLALEEPERDIKAIAAFDIALSTGNVDCFVSAYRGYPRLLTPLAETAYRPALEQILLSSQDTALARSLGLPTVRSPGNASRLSPREQEVAALLTQGLTNRQIASKLFVSEATVKVHVRHVLEKLGVRTRTEAALMLAMAGETLTQLPEQPQIDDLGPRV
jgi:DNA-binding CsgD family transcriptional regulator